MATQLPIRMSDELRTALKTRAEQERRTEAATARLILEDALLGPQNEIHLVFGVSAESGIEFPHSAWYSAEEARLAVDRLAGRGRIIRVPHGIPAATAVHAALTARRDQP